MSHITPIHPRLRLEVLSADELAELKSATLHILENVGVKFPSERALRVLADHGAQVDVDRQIVKLSPDLVIGAMDHAPRSYLLAGRADGTELLLDGTNSFYGTDGCGVETVDFDTGEQRPSRKDDVAAMARVSDYLSTVKHVQTETTMGEKTAHYAVRMAEVVAGGRAALRTRPPLSSLICTIAPLCQDKEGIEAAMVFAQAGIPVGFMGMPTMGSTAPAVPGGALAIANAEVVSAMVLMQLVSPGAPVCHSILVSAMDPHSADYIVSTPEKYLCNVAAVQMAHDWGVPALAGTFGVDAAEPATWQLGRDSVYTALMCALGGTDMTIGLGMLGASTLLVPEQIIFDDEIYHTHRILVEGLDIRSCRQTFDVIASVGPGGHFLAQKHTRRHVRERWIPELTHPRPSMDGKALPGIRQRARAMFDRILATHEPEPLDEAAQAELRTILKVAEQDLGL
jgi:trimethylamine--corrinoid protein Co-methyltransferase